MYINLQVDLQPSPLPPPHFPGILWLSILTTMFILKNTSRKRQQDAVGETDGETENAHESRFHGMWNFLRVPNAGLN